MTPQGKLIPLREQFLYILLAAGATETDESTKKCVNVAVDAIIESINTFGDHDAIESWQQVKQENENL